jgi:chromosome segregation ATPase
MFHFKTQLDELSKFKTNNKMTRSMEQTYLEKCRDFVEMMIASESLVSMSEMNYDDETNYDNEEMDVDNNNKLTDDMIIICNEYKQYCQQECRQILDKYQLDMTEYCKWYEKELNEYCKWYEKELNEYYTDYTQTILWDYYENTTKKLEEMNQSLMAENHNLSKLIKSIEEIETNYNNVKKEHKHLSSEYNEIYRRLLIMISEYHKLYNQYHKYKNEVKKTAQDNVDEFIYIGNDYEYN